MIKAHFFMTRFVIVLNQGIQNKNSNQVETCPVRYKFTNHNPRLETCGFSWNGKMSTDFFTLLDSTSLSADDPDRSRLQPRHHARQRAPGRQPPDPARAVP